MEIERKEDIIKFVESNSKGKYSNNKDIRNKQFKIVDYLNENECNEIKDLAFCTDDENLLKLDNIYALILYSLLYSKKEQHILISIEMLRYVLGCNNKYANINNFKSRCIYKPVEQIYDKTGLVIDALPVQCYDVKNSETKNRFLFDTRKGIRIENVEMR